MTNLVLLAHGALGYWDETVFFGIGIVFTVFMLYSYISSRNFEPELDNNEDQADQTE